MAGRSFGMILLAIFLILFGLVTLVPTVGAISGLNVILALLAAGAGLCILLGR